MLHGGISFDPTLMKATVLLLFLFRKLGYICTHLLHCSFAFCQSNRFQPVLQCMGGGPAGGGCGHADLRCSSQLETEREREWEGG